MGRLLDDPPHAQTLTERQLRVTATLTVLTKTGTGPLKSQVLSPFCQDLLRDRRITRSLERTRAGDDALRRPRRSVLSLSLSVIWAASIGRRNHGKEIDTHDPDETQNREGQIGPRSGSE